jgi:hypothetical protein
MDYKIIDNALSNQDFLNIKNTVFRKSFNWYFSNTVANEKDNKYFYFTHYFYEDCVPKSEFFLILSPILNILKPKSLIRIKANLYPNLGKEIKNDIHVDFNYTHKGALFYINTNNGFTELEDGSKIESIENRLLLFDSSKKHRSTHCTDKKSRVNINFNYF